MEKPRQHDSNTPSQTPLDKIISEVQHRAEEDMFITKYTEAIDKANQQIFERVMHQQELAHEKASKEDK
jgi:hypothetical protein